MANISQALNALEISIDCPKCGAKLKKTLGWLKAHPDFPCTCGTAFDAHQLRQAIAAAERSAEGLRKQLSKPIKINLKL